MNINEKISLYKDILDLKSYQEFGEEAEVSGDWINELSKKDELKLVDIQKLIKLCNYLGITVEQFIEDDVTLNNNAKTNKEIKNIDDSCNDIGTLINEMVTILDEDGITIDGKPLNHRAKKMCIDALEITKMLTKQYL